MKALLSCSLSVRSACRQHLPRHCQLPLIALFLVSGMLSNDEFRRIAPEMGVNLTPNGLRKAFEHLDADGSGTVEFEEFLKWHFADKVEAVMSIEEKIKLEKAKSQAQAAKTADKSGEMGNVMDHARSVFKKFDKDGSGTISPDEFAELCYDMGERGSSDPKRDRGFGPVRL